jgi:non-haem Fe2+, alpha-ketoglutarate-dependent halogenase
MPKVLNEAAIRQYRDEGYYFPVPVLTVEETLALRQKLETFESSQGHPLDGAQRSKSHLLFKWVDDLMRDDRLVDAIEDLIGPDILCWNSVFWIKEAHTPSYVGWHQDLKYWGLDNDELVSVWIALSPATRESGCMSVLPGSHRRQMLAHDDTYHENNMLSRGQEIAVDVDKAKTVLMALEPGQASFHNVKSAHGSGPNNSADRRIGLSLHYMPTHTRQTLADWDTAALVRGEDRFGNFVHTPRPAADFDPDAVAFHDRATAATREIVYKDSAAESHSI